jgi:uncharacterized tellurite resistance protein B-like protein
MYFGTMSLKDIVKDLKDTDPDKWTVNNLLEYGYEKNQRFNYIFVSKIIRELKKEKRIK